MTEPLLRVENLVTRFTVRSGSLFARAATIDAVNDVSFTVLHGETLAVVGESGCGKSTLGRSILRLVESHKGRIVWQGTELGTLGAEALRRTRRDMQIIFQDPIASLDPRMTVGDIVAEPLDIFEPGLSRNERSGRVAEILDAVGLAPNVINRYPHEFSGGQAQRIGIARALITRPRLVICDEPVSALDVSIQAQIIMLLRKLRDEFDLTMLFISHDLSVVRLISDRVMVLYLGRIAEIGECGAIFDNPAHPYTRALLSAAPVPDPQVARSRKRIMLKGDPPSPLKPPSGCVFSSRCWLADERCRSLAPALTQVRPGHAAACHYPEKVGD